MEGNGDRSVTQSALATLKAEALPGPGVPPLSRHGFHDWRQVALARAHRCRYELLAASENGGARDGRAESTARQILLAERVVEEAATLKAWYDGSQQEAAWDALHEAEAEIIELLSGDDLVAHTNDVLVQARTFLPKDDPRLLAVVKLRDAGPQGLAAGRSQVTHLARAASNVSDASYAQSRGFRNRLIKISIVGTLAALVFLLTAGFMNLDFNGTGGISSQMKGWEPAILILLFGCIGALVSEIPSAARAGGMRNPFSLPFWRMIMKLCVGPLFAITGIFIMQGGVVTGLQAQTTLLGLSVWAALFGASQKSVTRFVDQRVDSILSGDEVKGAKETKAKEVAAAPTVRTATGPDPAFTDGELLVVRVVERERDA